MIRNKFTEQLEKIQKKNNSLVCIGLDTDLKKIPQFLLKKTDPVFEFNKAIINKTYNLVCSYKPNIAFYEAYGEKGIKSLKKTIDFLKKRHPQIPIILDAKKADIGSTNEAYIKLIFNYLKVDAVTLHPYLGKKALAPFLRLKNKFFFILCRTSNPGASELQDLKVKSQPLYQYLAKQIKNKWNQNNNCGLVIGATYPKELKEIRKIVKSMILLIPGIGKQGGDIEKTVKAGKDRHNKRIIINSSRAIIFASNKKDFARKARLTTNKLRKEINKYL